MVFVKCNEVVERKFALGLFMDYYKLPLAVQEAAQLHASLTDTWYSRLDIDDLTLEKSTSAVEEIMQTILALMKKSRSLNPFSKASIPTFHDLT